MASVQADGQADEGQESSISHIDDLRDVSKPSHVKDDQTRPAIIHSSEEDEKNTVRTDISNSVSDTNVVDVISTSDVMEQDSLEPRVSVACPDIQNGGKESVVEEARSGGHRAGYDAFMTGFSMAFFVAKYGRVPESCTERVALCDLGLEDLHNKVYLCGKDIPMSISKSTFAKTSKDHREKFQKLSRPSVI